MATRRQIEDAWEKARTIRGKNPDVYRRDDHGNPIYFASYGKNSEMGWEVDHKKPLAAGGSNHPKNLRALQTGANRSKGAKHPHR